MLYKAIHLSNKNSHCQLVFVFCILLKISFVYFAGLLVPRYMRLTHCSFCKHAPRGNTVQHALLYRCMNLAPSFLQVSTNQLQFMIVHAGATYLCKNVTLRSMPAMKNI